MQLFVSCLVSAFLVLNVLGAHGVLSSDSGKQCGVLENILQKQAYLEKKVEAHSKILAGGSCTEGTIVDKFIRNQAYRFQIINRAVRTFHR